MNKKNGICPKCEYIVCRCIRKQKEKVEEYEFIICGIVYAKRANEAYLKMDGVYGELNSICGISLYGMGLVEEDKVLNGIYEYRVKGFIIGANEKAVREKMRKISFNDECHKVKFAITKI